MAKRWSHLHQLPATAFPRHRLARLPTLRLGLLPLSRCALIYLHSPFLHSYCATSLAPLLFPCTGDSGCCHNVANRPPPFEYIAIMNGHFAAVGEQPTDGNYEHGVQVIDEEKEFK